MPDDGTGSLPLLRHVIVNDNKSSTYKLGLLRTLVRLAETAPGLIRGAVFEVLVPLQRPMNFTLVRRMDCQSAYGHKNPPWIRWGRSLLELVHDNFG